MNIKDLEAVEAVYRYRSFSEAAFQTDFSISAISKQIARVEEELNVKIFERGTKGSQLNITEIGDILIPQIIKLLDDYSDITYLSENYIQPDKKTLSIGIMPLIGTIGENEIISNFAADYPEVCFDYSTGDAALLLKELMTGKLDAVFIMMMGAFEGNFKSWEALTNDELVITHIMQNKNLYIGMSANHALAKKKSIKIKDILDETFIFSNFQNPDNYTTRIGVIQALTDGLDHNIKSKFMDFNNRNVVLSLVEKGRAVLPQVNIPCTYGKNIVYIKVEGWPDSSFGIFVKRKSNKSLYLSRLCTYVDSYVQKGGAKL